MRATIAKRSLSCVLVSSIAFFVVMSSRHFERDDYADSTMTRAVVRVMDRGGIGSMGEAHRSGDAPEKHLDPEKHVDRSHADVVLQDRSVVKIRWRRLPIPSMKISPPLADHYSMLRRKAEMGNPEAAYTLYRILESCKFAYEDERGLNEALHKLNTTHMIRAPEMAEPVLLRKEESVRNWRTILRKSYQACVGISQQQRSERSAWLEQASNGGYPIAMREYSRMIHEYESGVSLDLTRWRQGDAQALRSLASRYSRSYDEGREPLDGISAYAAMFAYAKLAAKNIERSGHQHNDRLDRVKSELRQLEEKLHIYEIELAMAEADELIRSNSNCCFAF